MQPRTLHFNDFQEVVRELDRLRTQGYTKAGQWNLAQICDHLAYFIEGALDGYTFRVPWLFKVLFGKLVFRRIIGSGVMRPGSPTPQKPLPEPTMDEAAAVARLKRALDRLQTHQGEFQPSPFFGQQSRDDNRKLTLIHCAHHLGFLIPNTTAGV